MFAKITRAGLALPSYHKSSEGIKNYYWLHTVAEIDSKNILQQFPIEHMFSVVSVRWLSFNLNGSHGSIECATFSDQNIL